MNFIFEAFSLVFTAADVIQFLGFLNIKLPDNKLNAFLILITADYGWFSMIPIAGTLFFNMFLSNKLIDLKWSYKSLILFKFLYNIADLVYEYTAICLANFSMRLVNYNLYLTIVVSILIG